jgi:hypothetical protein
MAIRCHGSRGKNSLLQSHATEKSIIFPVILNTQAKKRGQAHACHPLDYVLQRNALAALGQR